MKTSIKKNIETAYDKWSDAQDDFTRIANQRIGFITGAPSIDEESAALDEAIVEFETVVCQSLAGRKRTKRRYNYVTRVLRALGDVPSFIQDILLIESYFLDNNG